MTAMEWAAKLAELKAEIKRVTVGVSPLEQHLDELIDDLRALDAEGPLAKAIAGVKE